MKNLFALLSDSKGELPAYEWPGGTPLIYLMVDGGTLCSKCVNGNIKLIVDATLAHDDKQWELEAVFPHYEGQPINCDNCYTDVESSYGDPEEI